MAVTASVDNGIGWITLDKPPANSYDRDFIAELGGAIDELAADDAAKVVVVRSASEKFFSAGADVKNFADSDADTNNAMVAFAHEVFDKLGSIDKLTIAAINGPAIQTGLSLALCCDFRIGSTQARLGSATLRFALLPDEGGHALLVQHLGLAQALDFVLRKRIVDADAALRLGLLNEVVAPEALLDTAMALAVELADGPQVAMRMLKRSLYIAAESTFAQALDDIAVRTAVTDHHPDARDGGRSFREKRAPKFNAWLEGGER